MTTTTTALAAFVTRRLDEDEATARAPLSINALAALENGEPLPRWKPIVDHGRLTVCDDRPVTASLAPGAVRVGHTWGAEAEHIARHDPARVLRQVAAHRRLLERHAEAERETRAARAAAAGADDAPGTAVWEVVRDTLYDALRMLAETWAEHPDYRQEWRP